MEAYCSLYYDKSYFCKTSIIVLPGVLEHGDEKFSPDYWFLLMAVALSVNSQLPAKQAEKTQLLRPEQVFKLNGDPEPSQLFVKLKGYLYHKNKYT